MNSMVEVLKNNWVYGVVALIVVLVVVLVVVVIKSLKSKSKSISTDNIMVDNHIEVDNGKAFFTIENHFEDLDIKVEIYERESNNLIIKGIVGCNSEIHKLPLITTLQPGTYSCYAKAWAYKGSKAELEGVTIDQSITLRVE